MKSLLFLVVSEDPGSVAVCLSSPEAGDILHGTPAASLVTMQFSLVHVHEARTRHGPELCCASNL